MGGRGSGGAGAARGGGGGSAAKAGGSSTQSSLNATANTLNSKTSQIMNKSVMPWERSEQAREVANLTDSMKVGNTITIKDYKTGETWTVEKTSSSNTVSAFHNLSRTNHYMSPSQLKGFVQESIEYANYIPRFG